MKNLKVKVILSLLLAFVLILSGCGIISFGPSDNNKDPNGNEPSDEPGNEPSDEPGNDPSDEPTDTKYNVYFKIDGNVIHTIQTSGKEEIELPSPTLENKVFEGWYSDEEFKTEFTKNSLLEVTLTNDYNVYGKTSSLGSLDLQLNDFLLENDVYKCKVKDINSIDISSKIVVDSNSTYKLTKNDNEIDPKNISLVEGDNIFVIVVLNGKSFKEYQINIYKTKYYTVTFNTNGGSSVAPKTVEENTKIVSPSTTKNGYKFEGWDYDFSKLVTKDLTINANWSKINYSIEYYDGSTKLSLTPSTYTVEENVTLPTYTKSGYNFLGWYTDSSLKTKASNIAKGSTGNVKLYAKTEEKQASYVNVDVKYELGGGTLSGASTLGEKIGNATLNTYLDFDSTGHKATLVSSPSWTYWYYIAVKKTEGNTYTILQIGYPKTAITVTDYDYLIGWHGDIADADSKTTLMSVYTDREYLIGSSVVINNIPQSTTTSANISVEFYKKAQTSSPTDKLLNPCTLPVPTKEGYSFKGWRSSVDNKVVFDYPGYTTNPGVITYTAQWESGTSTTIATCASNLNAYMASYQEVSSSITLPTTKDGCSLTWTSSDTSVLSNDGKLLSSYTSKQITLSCVISDGTIKETYTYIINVKGTMKDLSKGVVGGYLYFSQSNIDEYTYKNLDIIYIAFAYIQPDGSIQNYSSIVSYCKKICDNAHKYGTRVVISFQHKTALTDFSTVAASQELSNTFASNVVKLINEVGFDGVDIDWEWPSSAQAPTFTTFIKTINQKVKANNPNHLVTAACGSYQSTRYDLANSKQYLDYVNLMTYDMQTSAASHHNALYYSSNNKSYYTDGSVTAYLKLVSANKLVLGIPFYGREATGATTGMGSGKFSTSRTHTYIYNTYLSTTENRAKYRVWDDVAKVPYIYDKENGVVITYDDEQSITIKCDYAKTKGLAGVMYWQDSQDMGNTLLTACVNGITKNYR